MIQYALPDDETLFPVSCYQVYRVTVSRIDNVADKRTRTKCCYDISTLDFPGNLR